jgi:hypothetical protein
MVLSAIIDMGDEAHFRSIAGRIQRQGGVFQHGLIFTLYSLEKLGFLTSVLVPDSMASISGFRDQRVFRMEQRGREAVREPALLEQFPELAANPLLELATTLKKIKSQPEPKFDSTKINGLFDEAILFWKDIGTWLPQPSLS